MPAYQPPAPFVAEVSSLLVQMGLRPLCTCGMGDTVPSTDGDCRSIGCDPSCPDPSCAEVLVVITDLVIEPSPFPRGWLDARALA